MIFTWFVGSVYLKWKFSFANFNTEKRSTKNLLLSLENEVYFFKKENPIFSIKLGQKLPQSFSQLHVKNSRFFRSYVLKKNNWPKAADFPLLKILDRNIIRLQSFRTIAWTLQQLELPQTFVKKIKVPYNLEWGINFHENSEK